MGTASTQTTEDACGEPARDDGLRGGCIHDKEFEPENVQGVVLGGFYEALPLQQPDTVQRFRLLTAYVEASWF